MTADVLFRNVVSCLSLDVFRQRLPWRIGVCSFKILSSQDTAWVYNSEKAFDYFIVVTQVGLQTALRGLGHTHTHTLSVIQLLLSMFVAKPQLHRMETRCGPVIDRVSRMSPQRCPSLISRPSEYDEALLL